MANKIVTCPRCRAKICVDPSYEKFTCGNCRQVSRVSEVLPKVTPAPSAQHPGGSAGSRSSSASGQGQSSSSGRKSTGSNSTTLLIVAVLAILLFIGMKPDSGTSAIPEPAAPAPSSAAPTAPPATTQPAPSEVAFSQSCRSGQDVYADIVSIVPEYGISFSYNGSSSTVNHSVVCRAVNTAGNTIWIYMSVSEYNDDFDSSANLQDMFGSFRELTYSPARKITGTAYKAESACEGLSEQIGCDLVLNYDS